MRAYMEHVRWPDGVKCLVAEATRFHELTLAINMSVIVESCGYHFSVTSGLFSMILICLCQNGLQPST